VLKSVPLPASNQVSYQALKSGAYLIAQLALLLMLFDSALAFAQSEPRLGEIKLGQVNQIQARGCVVAFDIRVLNAPKGTLNVALASPAQYETADATFPRWLAGANIETRQIQGRTDRIHLCSTQPADNPLLELILRLKTSAGSVQRNVMLVIDPLPGSRGELMAEPPPAPLVQPTVQTYALPEAGKLTQKNLVSKPKKTGTAQPQPSVANEPAAPISAQVTEPTLAPATPVEPAAAEATPAEAALPTMPNRPPMVAPWWQTWLDLIFVNANPFLLGVGGLLLVLALWLLGRRFIPNLGRFRPGSQRDGVVRDFSLFGPGSRPPKGASRM
jgi:hypothetical protein